MHIVSSDEMYAIDQYAINKIGMSGNLLMENAGRAIFDYLKNRVKKTDRIGVMIGKGNNGGDGFVLARYLYHSGYRVDVWLVPEQHEVIGDAKAHMEIFLNSGGSFRSYQEGFYEESRQYHLIVDALLGIGIKGKLRYPYDEIIQHINQLKAKIISVDIPSGVSANGGSCNDEAVRADETLTLHCPKCSQFTFPAATFYGKTRVLDIGIPPTAEESIEIEKSVWTSKHVVRSLPKRPRNSHKGSYGKGLLIAGTDDMPGAATLSSYAAIRSGIGLLSVYAPESIRHIIAAKVPEVTFYNDNGTRHIDISEMTKSFNVVAIGPGLGRDQYSQELVEQIIPMGLPLIIDADGLYQLQNYLTHLKSRIEPTILTPHAGEMARLCKCSISDIENNRFGISRDFAVEHHAYVVLKGPYTIISTPEGKQYVNLTGNPALAKGGSGDVLTGMILAFIKQHHHIQEALCNAVFVHGRVADDLIQTNHSMLDVRASDVVDGIPKVLHTLYEKYGG